MNFASAKKPGRGFINGAQAQEESLARSSSLYASLSEAPTFYDINERANSKVYTHNIIYSERITVFRDNSEDEDLLENPYIVDMITCPAVNRRITNKMNDNEVNHTMVERARRILCVAVKHKVQHLVLGAWANQMPGMC